MQLFTTSLRIFRFAALAIVVPIAVLVWIVAVPILDLVSSALGSATSLARRKSAGTKAPVGTRESSELASRLRTTDDIAVPAAPQSARRAS